ncbi:unnamed protein product [Paramecium sonneborni]|uniref:Uncharacterized protein n=1 Tax=Paramecium sonneborni TaxID=65129 RepID=A0A8S1PIL5_9CILI|nr:unnamed protein product [Paramecium sonneborni]
MIKHFDSRTLINKSSFSKQKYLIKLMNSENNGSL